MSRSISPTPSNASSELSPPPSPCISPFDFPANSFSQRSTPPTSQTDSSSSNEDGDPPSKRRKLSNGMPRQTYHLQLDFERPEHGSDHWPQFDRLMKCLSNKRKIVVIAGAGISVSAGIPDFRSSTGLFKNLKSEHNLKGSGKDLFDASVYRDPSSTSTFHTMVRSMSEQTKLAQPTVFHHLIARLAKEDRLLRLYSQNVDGLETSLQPLQTMIPLPRKGPWPKTIQLHGGLDTMTCSKCLALKQFTPEIFKGPDPPLCESCVDLDNVRTEHGGKRSHGVGKMRPRMVLYNEHNPDDEAIGAVAKADMRTRPDAVIVVGTTLKVPGVRRIVREMCGIVRDRRDGLAVWINRDPVPSGKDIENSWDLIVKADADDVARHVGLPHWDQARTPPGEEITKEACQDAKKRSNPNVKIRKPLILLPPKAAPSSLSTNLNSKKMTKIGAGFKIVGHENRSKMKKSQTKAPPVGTYHNKKGVIKPRDKKLSTGNKTLSFPIKKSSKGGAQAASKPTKSSNDKCMENVKATDGRVNSSSLAAPVPKVKG